MGCAMAFKHIMGSILADTIHSSWYDTKDDSTFLIVTYERVIGNKTCGII